MTKHTFGHCEREEIVLSVFKRCITLLVCKHRLVLRLPSEDKAAQLKVYIADDIAKDLVKEDHKLFLGEYFKGNHVKYEGYDAQGVRESLLAASYIDGTATAPSTPLFRPMFDICAKVVAPQTQQSVVLGTPMGTPIEQALTRPDPSPQRVSTSIKSEETDTQTLSSAIVAAMNIQRSGETIIICDDCMESEHSSSTNVPPPCATVKSESRCDTYQPETCQPTVETSKTCVIDIEDDEPVQRDEAYCFISLPCFGYFKQMMVPRKTIDAILPHGVLDTDRAADGSVRYVFKTTVASDMAVLLLRENLPNRYQRGLDRLYKRPLVCEGGPDEKRPREGGIVDSVVLWLVSLSLQQLRIHQRSRH